MTYDNTAAIFKYHNLIMKLTYHDEKEALIKMIDADDDMWGKTHRLLMETMALKETIAQTKYTTLEEINTNPIYQPPSNWLVELPYLKQIATGYETLIRKVYPVDKCGVEVVGTTLKHWRKRINKEPLHKSWGAMNGGRSRPFVDVTPIADKVHYLLYVISKLEESNVVKKLSPIQIHNMKNQIRL